MAQAASLVAERLSTILQASNGLGSSVERVSKAANLALAPIGTAQVVAQDVASEIAEKASGARYPSFYVYCDRVSNTLREKFRVFSGTARLIVDVRVSEDRPEPVERQLQLYVDAVTQVLEENRGD